MKYFILILCLLFNSCDSSIVFGDGGNGSTDADDPVGQEEEITTTGGDDIIILPPVEIYFSYHESSQLSYYFFENVLIDSNEIDASDWVGVFKGDICVGSRKWSCDGPCDVPVYGEGDLDLNPLTEGYMLPGDLPSFKIYDASENMYYDATPSEQIPWQQLGMPVIESLISQ